QLSISSVSSSLPTNESTMIRDKESPPKGLVQRRREQFNNTITADEYRPVRSRSVPISAVILNAQQPSRSTEGNFSPTRKVQIDRIRYDFRAPADILRRTPEDRIGDECCETTTTTERLSDGDKRTVRVIREVGDNSGRRMTQPISRTAARIASHSAPRGFPIVTVSVADPHTRRRSLGELHQPAVVQVRDNVGSTVIPVTRSSSTAPDRSASPTKRMSSRPSSRRAVQVELYDSASLTIPPPTDRHRFNNNSSASTPILWSPVSRPLEDVEVTADRREIDVEKEITRRERELNLAKDTIKKLSNELKRIERDKQQLEIEVKRQHHHSERSSRVVDTKSGFRPSSCEPCRPTADKKSASTTMTTATLFDPAAIKQECERMMEVLRRERSSEEELADASEVDREIERLKREVSAKQDSVMRAEQQSTMKRSPSQSIASTSTEDDSDSSQIVSVQDQVVMYNGGSSASSGGDSRVALINKLERELTDAQLCNLRLNAKIGSLVSGGNATIKKEVIDLKKDLKDRTSEVDNLKKKLQKAEKDRQQWETQKRQLESKLPIDVQLLMAQKRELTMQLDREQNEKHELFLQINSMVAQLAETQPAGEVEKLKTDNKELKRRMEELEASSNRETSRLEADLQKARNESELMRHQSEREKRQLQEDLEETKKELHMKAAALQSLMLATQDSAITERLKEENQQLTNLLREAEAALATAKRDLDKKDAEIDKLVRASEDSAASSEQLEMFEKKLSDAEKVLKQEMATKEALKQSCEQLINDGKQAEEKLNEWRAKHEEDQNTIAELRNDIEQLEKEAKEMVARNRRWEFERDEEVKTLSETLMKFEATLKEKDSKINAIQVQLLDAQSRAEQAEADLKAKEQVVVNTDRRVQQLQAQLDAKGNADKEVELLQEELKKSEERHNVVLERHQKAEAAALEASKGQKQLIDELEKKLGAADEARTETETKLSALQKQLKSSNDDLNEKAEHIKKLEEELTGLQNEKKKLESRASVADELNTLMSSLSAVRAENGQYQEEIRALHRQVQEIKEELERSMEECEEWKGRAETAEKEKEVMERRISNEKEKLIALESSTESHKAHEAELESNTTKLEAENVKLKEETRDLQAELKRMQSEQKVAEEESMRKLRELTEKCEAIQKEADTSRSKVGELEEEHHRFRDATTEERKKLLETAEEQREKVEELQEEVAEMKEKLKAAEEVTAAEVKRYEAARARLAEVEREYGEMKSSLQNIQGFSTGAPEKSLENENLAIRIKQQLEELEKDKAAKLQEMAAEHRAHQERLEKRIEDMETARLEQIKELENQKRETEELYQKRLDEAERRLADESESHRIQVEKLEITLREKTAGPKKEIEELRKTNAEMTTSHIEQCEKLNKKIVDLETRLSQASKNNAEMVTNLQNMTVLLETEAKKREELTEERKRWLAEMDEKERLLDEARNSSEEEAKISALAAENVRLASEVLKAHSQAEETLQVEKEVITKQFNEKLKIANNERDKLATDLEALRAKMKVMESRIEDQRSSIEQAEKVRKDEIASIQAELDAVRKEKAMLKDDLENLRSNNNGHPVPPPRRTISNMSTYTYNTQTDFSEIEDVHKLRSEIDKQKRLIIVLRRKLQGLQ
ncbi:hypothetical protein V3C99_014583, partial [Haemonchus contortus]